MKTDNLRVILPSNRPCARYTHARVQEHKKRPGAYCCAPGRFLFGWYAYCKHITPHHYCKRCGFVCVRYGGAEESRTPVRKPIHTPFYERSLLLKFPFLTDNKRTVGKSSFIKSWQIAKLKSVHVHRWCDTGAGTAVLPGPMTRT